MAVKESKRMRTEVASSSAVLNESERSQGKSNATGALPSREFYKATSFLSIWGPCRGIGDEYLSCVTTEGMGMCKPLRRQFEQCTNETRNIAITMLDQLALQACSHVEAGSPSDTLVVKRNCAAEFILRQQNGPRQS